MLSIFWASVSGGDKLGFLKTDSLSVSKYINASLCCLRKTQNKYIKSSAICVYVGSQCVALIALQEFRADKKKASNPRPHAPHPTRRLENTATPVFCFFFIIFSQFCPNSSATQQRSCSEMPARHKNAIFGQRTCSFLLIFFICFHTTQPLTSILLFPQPFSRQTPTTLQLRSWAASSRFCRH